jgi:predicted Rossmann fold nucleotide-binding protein DprA/Smf involved in DNA uptake
MIIGFTGTRKGMTQQQHRTVTELVSRASTATHVIHGDCIGADYNFHNIAVKAGLSVVLRPCNLSNQRAYSEGAEKVYEPEKPIARNHKIVSECSGLIACPGKMTEEMRSGTWATIRYARQNSKRVVIVWPDGSSEER